MAYFKSLTPDRENFVHKIYSEMDDNARTNISDRENYKKKFLQLVKENKELSENEKDFCKEDFIYQFELNNVLYGYGEPRECKNCNSTKYSDRFCEKCISLHLQSLFSTWTSGNKIVDGFIQQCQILSSLPNYILEWIPFEQFENVTKLTEGGFSSIYSARWIRGRIFDYDENKKEFVYLSWSVVLKSLNNSNNLGKTFFDEVIDPV